VQSKNKAAPTAAERRHIERVKDLECSVCDTRGPSECHEMEQGAWWLSIALCADCHRGGFNGIHGQRRIWSVKKLTELGALGITIQRLMERAYA
jgi:hypothetical protein